MWGCGVGGLVGHLRACVNVAAVGRQGRAWRACPRGVARGPPHRLRPTPPPPISAPCPRSTTRACARPSRPTQPGPPSRRYGCKWQRARRGRVHGAARAAGLVPAALPAGRPRRRPPRLQLYVAGEFVGGADIVDQMAQSGGCGGCLPVCGAEKAFRQCARWASRAASGGTPRRRGPAESAAVERLSPRAAATPQAI